tara:strand:- start:3482 stop:4726 length:1245 start_codon:yes stop_codon:yes gene_type:complete
MALNLGVAALSSKSNTHDPSLQQSQINALAQNGIAVRVVDIILNEDHPEFNNFGGWSSIGTISYKPIVATDIDNGTEFENYAMPLNPQSSYFPLINEIVIIFNLPSKQNLKSVSDSPIFYYLSVVNLWNTVEHNAYPDLSQPRINNSATKSPQQIEQGSTIKTPNTNTEIKLNSFGGTFVEKGNILPILPFAGDNILQGRFANSIRLGNTARTSGSFQNNWSNSGESGSPITIIRNGQPENVTNDFEPYIENINEDPSSIYLTTTQQIPISSSIRSFPALNNQPETLSSYNKSQVILNSSRLSFISRENTIIESNGQATINSIGDVGLYSKEGNINLLGNLIRIGDLSANQSLVLGDEFMSDFKVLMRKITQLCNSLSSEPKLTVSKATANSLKITSEKMKNIDNYLSKISKTL